MLKTLTVLILLTSGTASAWTPSKPSNDWSLVELQEISLRYQDFKDRRDPYTPQHDANWGYKTSLDWDVSLLKYGFWNNEVHAEGLKDGRVKTVGWHWFLGVQVPTWGLAIFHEHHSQHILDERPLERDGDDLPQGYRKFSVEDSYGVRLTLYSRGATNP